ncbi:PHOSPHOLIPASE A2-ACTIVATING PROTEIN [Salix purpurea]|uniref:PHOSPHOLIPASE A2-ACTIVATING PROTEIN n=1 Tax=Salix purpurea TaxID=77065 RepID=A0A9Q0PQH0_SALPP|nr:PHOSPHOLIPASE A2-ACTIVATING PROTEIN [Salix purpurea]
MDMEIDFKNYQLSHELRGHEDDVRGICVCGNAGIATSSRDKTVRYWVPDPTDKRKYESSKILLGHSSFVGPLAWIPPNPDFVEGAIVSGGMDTMVFVWNLSNGEKVLSLKGHHLQVTGLVLDDEDIVSCSVDCTLRRWRKGQLVENWEAHKSAIQAIIKLTSGELVTGSTDTTLKLWKGRTCLHTFAGHSDTVRGLAEMHGLGILSASHDGSIRLWSLTGEVLMEMVGHASIVYSVDSHVSGLIVSGSEDCSAKIWKDGACVQSIEHPGCVWDVKFLENGDIVTACSDGALSRKRVGGLKLEDLPGLEALQIPGTTDGQTKVIREGDNGVAYAWDLREQKWDKIGEVVDGPEDGMKLPVLDGFEYDYVFDVDIGDGEPIRKLPYNRSDNPYDTADKWLLKENLPLTYRQQIVEFILQNSGQGGVALDSSFRDPYTGANAYIPGGSSSMSVVSAKPTFKHIPKKGMLVFDVAQFDGILKKITEFHNSLLSDPVKKDLSLSELEISRLGAVIKILKDTSHYHTSRFADADIALLLKLLKSWPLAMIFPVIDILRMLVLHPDGATVLLKHVEDENDILMEMIKRNSLYHTWLQKHQSEILDAFSSCYSSPNKNLQLSYATMILNYAVLLIEKKDLQGQSQVLTAALEIAEGENIEVDSKFRALVAVGSLMLDAASKTEVNVGLCGGKNQKLQAHERDQRLGN